MTKIKKSEYNRRYRNKTKDKARLYRSLNKIKIRSSMLRVKYGITILEYQEILNEQNNKCRLCYKHIDRADQDNFSIFVRPTYTRLYCKGCTYKMSKYNAIGR